MVGGTLEPAHPGVLPERLQLPVVLPEGDDEHGTCTAVRMYSSAASSEQLRRRARLFRPRTPQLSAMPASERMRLHGLSCTLLQRGPLGE